MAVTPTVAPGAPGIPARWTSSAKSGVGTALSPAGQIWFTISHGILNEIYYPRVDSACTRDLGLIVTGPDGYFSEEKRDADACHRAVRGRRARLQAGQHRDRRRLPDRKAHPCRSGTPRAAAGNHLHAAEGSAPATTASTPCWRRIWSMPAWATPPGSATTRESPMLFASGRGICLALASSLPWRTCSAGYVGFSDGWQQLQHGGRLDPGLPAGRGRQCRADRRDRLFRREAKGVAGAGLRRDARKKRPTMPSPA